MKEFVQWCTAHGFNPSHGDVLTAYAHAMRDTGRAPAGPMPAGGTKIRGAER